MIGRTPGNIHAIRPMKDGVIADYVITEAMLSHFIGKVRKGRVGFGKPEVMICVPAGVTSVEKRAVRDAALKAGAKEAYLIEEPLAAAIGANVPISGPSGNMIIDIGGGTSEIAVIALGGIVVSHSLRVGGNRFDEAIATYIRKKYNLMVGERTAEEVKIAIGTALPLERELTMEVRGRDLIAGLPRTIPITSSEVMEAIEAPLQQLVAAVRSVLEQTPPELSSDIIDKGMVMSGGGALLRNIDKLLTQVTGVPCHVAENPLNCVALGHRPRAGALRLLQEVAGPAGLMRDRGPRGAPRSRRAHVSAIVHCRAAFVDLHVSCHIGGASTACRRPGRREGGGDRGLDAHRDHGSRPDRCGARGSRELAPAGLTVIVGEEVKTRDGDLICVFLERAIPPGLSAVETIAAAREQGGLVGLPHPFDRMRGSILTDAVDGPQRHIRGLGREPQRPRRRQAATSTLRRSRASTGCPASPCPTRTRSWRSASRTWRSTATRRRRPACLPRSPARSSSPAGRATSSGSGRRWRRASTGCAATAGSGAMFGRR